MMHNRFSFNASLIHQVTAQVKTGLVYVGFAVALTACANQDQGPREQTEMAKERNTEQLARSASDSETGTTIKANAEEPVYGSFEAETLFSLLVAEIAGYRQRPDITLAHYIQEAHRTKDAGVIKRAITIANYLDAQETIVELTSLWQEAEPDSIAAHTMAADQFIGQGKRLEALDAIDKVLALDGSYSFKRFNASLELLEAQNYDDHLLALKQLSGKYPKNIELLLGVSRLQQLSGLSDDALASSKKALSLNQGYEASVILHGRQLFDFSEDKNDALKFLQKATSDFPQSKRLQLNYLQTLIILQKKNDAIKQMKIIERVFPGDLDLKLSMALLAWESKMDPQAKGYLIDLKQRGHRVEEANYYLGRIAASEGDLPAAIAYFEEIKPGPNYVATRLHIAVVYNDKGDLKKARSTLIKARENQAKDSEIFYNAESELLVDAGKFEAALSVLNSAVEEFSISIRLLYSRAMLAERMGKLDVLERDLLKVIDLDPQNASALNALGYTLTDQTDRHQEALAYIMKAFEITPQDPAVVDSMGWVQYRLGNTDAAIKHLRQANSMVNDQEIVAHLGEVLWVSGEQQEAMIVWKKGLSSYPDSQVLKDVMKKFAP